MAEDFKPIETQEAFDNAIKERIERAKESVRKEYEGFDAYKTKAEEFDSKVNGYESKIQKLNEALSGKDASISDLQKKVAKYEADSAKTRIAAEYGLPEDMFEFLTGKDEKEWRKQAEKLAARVKRPYPSRDHTEPTGNNSLAVQLQRQLKR